ncbi:hypothetical protein BSIN_5044 [Burkholderia singularis]|uniref:Uncharacterized protein n=1 Tax=Burkholderia singularis TaxID=1503053 RepID=A0A238HB41_9BURK|nr:hypothetical protein BSIN_5044 [Burkholderia singularis]
MKNARSDGGRFGERWSGHLNATRPAPCAAPEKIRHQNDWGD